jgi:hypothetical protein
VILGSAIRSAAGIARDALRVVGSAGSHAAWWLDYRVGGRTRDSRSGDDRR